MSDIKAYTASWLSHRKALQQLVEACKDEHLTYKPWEKGMSFAELVLHIVNSAIMFVNIVKEGEFRPYSERPDPGAFSTIAALSAYVNEQTEKTKAILESLTAEQLERTVQFAHLTMSGQAMLDMSKEHEIHHKGQLFTYARLCGVENLPFFIAR